MRKNFFIRLSNIFHTGIQIMKKLTSIAEAFRCKKSWLAWFVFAFPLLVLFVVEILNKKNFFALLAWPFFSPVELLINYIIVLCVFGFFAALFGRIRLSAAVTFTFLAFLSLVSSCKENLLGEPLFPWDIFLCKLALNLIPHIYNSFSFFNLLMIALAIGLVLLIFMFSKKYIVPIKFRVLLIIISTFAIYSFSCNTYISYIFLPKIGVSNMEWVQMENYDKNGLLLAFMMNMKNIMIEKPKDYNKDTLLSEAEAATSSSCLSTPSSPKSSSVKPNVIIMMSEAFWDPTLLKNVSYSSDPIPNIRKLSSSSSSGKMLSPSYGGGTSNVEFEVLTGNSMAFFPDGSNPYQEYINKPIPSLASIFVQNGYNSVAVHSYYKWFFNRDKVYSLIGFQKFISINDFKNPKYKGIYISDDEIANMIINEHKKSKKPLFLYAITMQNHGPYDISRYNQKFDIDVKSNKLSNKNLAILKDYTQGAHDADKSLKEVVDYFKKVKEPTMVVFFGDHLPMLGNDFSVYRESGFVGSNKSGWSNEEYKQMYSTPLIIWTNYKTERKDLKTIGACYLGAYIMDKIGIKTPEYFKYLNTLYKSIPGDTKYLKIGSDGSLYNGNNLPDNLKRLENTHWMFEYDLMFGKGYTKDILFNNLKN